MRQGPGGAPDVINGASKARAAEAGSFLAAGRRRQLDTPGEMLRPDTGSPRPHDPTRRSSRRADEDGHHQPPAQHGALGSPSDAPAEPSGMAEMHVQILEPIGSMSISPAQRDVVLGARKGLFIVDLDNPYDHPRVLHNLTTWEVADIQWNPHPSRANWVASTSNQKFLIWNLDRPTSDFASPQGLGDASQAFNCRSSPLAPPEETNVNAGFGSSQSTRFSGPYGTLGGAAGVSGTYGGTVGPHSFRPSIPHGRSTRSTGTSFLPSSCSQDGWYPRLKGHGVNLAKLAGRQNPTVVSLTGAGLLAVAPGQGTVITHNDRLYGGGSLPDDYQPLSPISHVLESHRRAITDINWSAFHPEVVASCGIDTWTWVWDLRMINVSDGARGVAVWGKPAQGYSSWNASATQVKWNRASEYRLATAVDNKVLIWDSRKGALPLATIEGHESRVYGLDWSRDLTLGKDQLITCSLDGAVKYWDLSSPSSQQSIGRRELVTQPTTEIQTKAPLWRARHLPFGRGVMTMPQRADFSVSMWSTDKALEHTAHHRQDGVLDGKADHTPPGSFIPPVHRFSGHKDVVKEFLFRCHGGADRTHDDRRFQLLTWSKDQTLRMWNVSESLTRSVGHVPGGKINIRLTRAGAPNISYRVPPCEQGLPPTGQSKPSSKNDRADGTESSTHSLADTSSQACSSLRHRPSVPRFDQEDKKNRAGLLSASWGGLGGSSKLTHSHSPHLSSPLVTGDTQPRSVPNNISVNALGLVSDPSTASVRSDAAQMVRGNSFQAHSQVSRLLQPGSAAPTTGRVSRTIQSTYMPHVEGAAAAPSTAHSGSLSTRGTHQSLSPLEQRLKALGSSQLSALELSTSEAPFKKLRQAYPRTTSMYAPLTVYRHGMLPPPNSASKPTEDLRASRRSDHSPTRSQRRGHHHTRHELAHAASHRTQLHREPRHNLRDRHRSDRGRLAGFMTIRGGDTFQRHRQPEGEDRLGWMARVKVDRDESESASTDSSSDANEATDHEGSSSSLARHSASEEQAHTRPTRTAVPINEEIMALDKRLVTFEKIEVAERYCVLTLYGPWARKEPAFVRVRLHWPIKYPHRPLQYELDRSPKVTLRTRAYMLRNLADITQRAAEEGQPSADQVVQFLRGDNTVTLLPIHLARGRGGEYHRLHPLPMSVGGGEEDDRSSASSDDGEIALPTAVQLPPRRCGASFGPQGQLVIFAPFAAAHPSRRSRFAPGGGTLSPRNASHGRSRSRPPLDSTLGMGASTTEGTQFRPLSAPSIRALGTGNSRLPAWSSAMRMTELDDPPRGRPGGEAAQKSQVRITTRASGHERFVLSYNTLADAMDKLVTKSQQAHGVPLGGKIQEEEVDALQLMSTGFLRRQVQADRDRQYREGNACTGHPAALPGSGPGFLGPGRVGRHRSPSISSLYRRATSRGRVPGSTSTPLDPRNASVAESTGSNGSSAALRTSFVHSMATLHSEHSIVKIVDVSPFLASKAPSAADNAQYELALLAPHSSYSTGRPLIPSNASTSLALSQVGSETPARRRRLSYAAAAAAGAAAATAPRASITTAHVSSSGGSGSGLLSSHYTRSETPPFGSKPRTAVQQQLSSLLDSDRTRH